MSVRDNRQKEEHFVNKTGWLEVYQIVLVCRCIVIPGGLFDKVAHRMDRGSRSLLLDTCDLSKKKKI